MPLFIPRLLQVLVCVLSATASFAGPLLKPDARVVFVGDSITGQGGNGGERGWVGLIRAGIVETQPGSEPTLVALGGSGQTVNGWTNVERRSRERAVFLDVKAFDVQQELARPADALVIMLGMNDVLSPQIRDTPEAWEKWTESYRQFVITLRERVRPGLIALATPTPCTEDVDGPKNVVMEKLAGILARLAKEQDCVLLPTRAAAWRVLHAGRRNKPDFHITGDQVHPNPAGHMAIAAGMLKGLGYETAAEELVTRAIQTAGDATVSHEVSLADAAEVRRPPLYRITLYHPAGQKPALSLPDGWSLQGDRSVDGGTEFLIRSAAEVADSTEIVANVGAVNETIQLPAPWLLATGNIGWFGWKSGVYDPETGRVPFDDVVRHGREIPGAIDGAELKPGAGPLEWRRYIGGVNYGGRGRSGAVDFAAATYFAPGETGYGLRWVKSALEREVTVDVSRMGFAGGSHVQVWVNGEAVVSADLAKQRSNSATLKLRAGWNLVSFKSNYPQWQWQLDIQLKPASGDSLDDLRYSTVPL